MCGSIAETVAYDFLLEVAMKVLHFQQRNVLLDGPWKWLVKEFASYYGVSDAYTKLRYLSYVMDVATPTEDCLTLIHDLLSPVKGNSKHKLSHQEAATGSPPPVLVPAVKLYGLLHDILSPETQMKFCRYFLAAAKKRSRRLQAETEEFILSNNDSALMDPMTVSTSYQKMKISILSIKNEIFTDIEIHNHNVLPSFIDLPNLSAPIYSVDLCSRLRAFLVASPPPGPSPPVIELVIATADFQRDLSSWNINLGPKIFGKYVQKFTKGAAGTYMVPDELGVLSNSMKRILYVLHSWIESQFESWRSCTPPGGAAIPGERLSEITVMLRANFRNYIQAIVEKLAENVNESSKCNEIEEDNPKTQKETVVESDVGSRMQPLKDLPVKTIENLHSVFEPHVFITVSRSFWDQMGQDVLHFLENQRENMSWYKGLKIAISILDKIFVSQMQKLLGNALQEKDLEPP
ncbi:hypothetical protein CRYUN_Cryun17cG0099800 [Craigia yunnanensis]